MRLFIATKIENQRLFEILEVLEKIPGINVVKKENLHITYKFIGESEEIEKYKELIDESVKNIKKFDIKIAGIDAFYDSFGNIKVIYAIPKSEELTNLGKNFDENFKPHLTLCRVKEYTRGLKNFLDEYEDEYFGTSAIDAVSLFSSTLTKEGPRYKEIYKKELIE
jgi:2'-5' RNA ligase